MATDAQILAKNYREDPKQVDLRSVPEGGLVTGSWMDSMVARGLAWQTNVGDLTTPIAGGGDTAIIDIDQPRLAIGVPAGLCMRPLRISVHCEPPLIAADNDEMEILIAVDRATFLPTDGTFVTEVPTNMRTDNVGGCPLTVNSLYSANMTAPTLAIELDRAIKVVDIVGAGATSAFWADLELVYEPERPPYIVGPATLYVYFGGTVATSGFISASFAAFPSSKVTQLV